MTRTTRIDGNGERRKRTAEDAEYAEDGSSGPESDASLR
jgi:hypothetical protein